MKKILLIISILLLTGSVYSSADEVKIEKSVPAKTSRQALKDYLKYFDKVYKIMNQNYYQAVDRKTYNKFIKNFKAKILPQLEGEGKSSDYVRWRGAAYMVDFLKSQEDIFSALYPPKPAKQYEQTALGVRMDLGLEGDVVENGFKLSQVEPRSDAYEKGLRINDIITQIGGEDIKSKTKDEIVDLLTPLMEAHVHVEYLSAADNAEQEVVLVPKEYFKQTVFIKPVLVPGVACLQIQKFNQKTSEDLLRLLQFVRSQEQLRGLILDLRGNPGGPPLAAREISAFFLPPGEEFAYFQKKKKKDKAVLDVPKIPAQYHYDGPLVILVNKESGSSSELFSGVLQRKKRAILMGTNSAGQVMLKSMFDLGDESMLLLVTARGHFPDGGVFSFGGINPDVRIPDDAPVDPIDFAARFIISRNKH